MFFLCFPFFVFFNRQKICFPPKNGHLLFIFQCLPLFLFSLFGASPLFFPFSFFVSLLFFSFFLPSCFLFSLCGSCFFLFVVFAFLFQDVLLFLFFCLLSCVVLNHNISFLFALHLVFWLLLLFCSFAILLFFDFWKPVKNISERMEIGKTAKMKNPEKKTDILTRAVSTVVFTHSVFFFFFVFLSILHFC